MNRNEAKRRISYALATYEDDCKYFSRQVTGQVLATIDAIDNECCRQKIEEAIEKVEKQEEAWRKAWNRSGSSMYRGMAEGAYNIRVAFFLPLLSTDTPDKPSEKCRCEIIKPNHCIAVTGAGACVECGRQIAGVLAEDKPSEEEKMRFASARDADDYKVDRLEQRIANLEASHRETINNEKCALSLRERVTNLEEQLEQEKKITNQIGKRLDKKRRKV